MVRRARGRRAGMGADGVHQEPRSAAGGGGRAQVPGRAAEPQGGVQSALERALLGRRHADCGMGIDEERPRQGRLDEPPSGGRNGERDFHGEKRSNDTHVSTTDPEAKLYRKGSGKEAKLSYIGNVMTENRHGLV